MVRVADRVPPVSTIEAPYLSIVYMIQKCSPISASLKLARAVRACLYLTHLLVEPLVTPARACPLGSSLPVLLRGLGS